MKSEDKVLSKGSKYYLDPALYSALVHYTKIYSKWLNEVRALERMNDDTSKRRLKMLEGRMRDIEDVCDEVAPEFSPLLLYAVTTHGVGYYELETMGIEVSRNTYYAKRRKFFYFLAKKLNLII